MRLLAVLPALVLLLTGCARAQEPVEVLDGRSDGAAEEALDVGVWERSPAVAQAMVAARAHWRAKDPGYEEDARVMDVAAGAFTEAGAAQHAVLYLMSLWPRCCPRMGVAVVEGDAAGGRLVRNVAFEATTQGLRALPDLDGDGRAEIALDGSFGMGGQVSRSATLATFTADGLADLGGTSLYDGSCGAMQDGEWAARVLAGPGPTFYVERSTKATCEDGTWEAEGERETLDLDPPAESGYVVLPVR